ncbi:hypothetical protein AMATHDRAFT_2825 [Amanita thiersii Skay4041]|uniref:Beta-lactamase-related domain-containing protein n=1 Tax=Amanita thiersii Skay4041 TaxID=703135 RepID=A0A2A9NQX6_9AGAR|nr:hypothetical protein AMATHDRAFT_2825 [Amanita thiersii Skay4041]
MVLLFTILINKFTASASYYPRDVPPSQRTLISSNINSFANPLLAGLNSSGLAVAVVRQDSSVPGGWRREFGFYGVAKDDGAPFTPDTLFLIASNSKLFLAYSVGLLISNRSLAQKRGKELTWTTKAKDIFPETGLSSHIYSLAHGPTGRAEAIANLKFLRPSAEFRPIFQYHNPGYDTLAHLPEVLLNQSYESYIMQHLFEPLNISSSTFSVKEAEASGRFAQGFEWDMRDQVKGVDGTRTAMIPLLRGMVRKQSDIFGSGHGELHDKNAATRRASQTRLPRPSNTQPPDSPFESLEKSYSDPVYGTLRPCYVNKGNSSSAFCSGVLKSPAVKRIIAAVDSNAPTIIIPFKGLSSHLCLKHFDKNIFNVSALLMNTEDREAEGYGSKGGFLVGLDTNFELEWVNPGKAGGGLAMKGGFWGGTPLQGKRESSAEVWFKLDGT